MAKRANTPSPNSETIPSPDDAAAARLEAALQTLHRDACAAGFLAGFAEGMEAGKAGSESTEQEG